MAENDATDPTHPRPEAPAPSEPARPRHDRKIKALFALAAVAIFGWLIVRQYLTPSIDGWGTDFNAALEQAARENRPLVALVFDSPQDFDYGRMVTVVKKPGNIEAMDKINAVRVQVRMDAADPLAVAYGVTRFPSVLLIGPDGELVTRWSGYTGEVPFRSEFLQGRPQR